MIEMPHKRFNPLTREWVLVSPQRTNRPWLGQVEDTPAEHTPSFDPTCSLCPGNTRANGAVNPDYTKTFVFDNDFPALLPLPTDLPKKPTHSLFRAEPESGYCKVVCFSPRHDLSLPDLSESEVVDILNTWKQESEQLGSRDDVTYVQVFENKGAVMGCSNPHPHSQIWATGSLPNEPAKELASQDEYYAQHKRALLLDYIQQEIQSGERLIAANDHFAAVVPFWAIWPFEVMIVSTQPISRLADCSAEAETALARTLLEVTRRYDRLFNTSFPYSMGFHQAPYDGRRHREWTLHAHFYPPLLRSATVRKFMVGFELLAMPQRDITPESAAKILRSLPIQSL
jgi:UDPglucose--hexose-1-phosphate uridylyltransferase